MRSSVQITLGAKKRFLSALLAVIMLLAFAPSALADSEHSNGNSGRNGTKTEQGKTKQDKTKTEERTKAEENKRYRGISVEKIAFAIDSISGEESKAELTALLDAYMAALDDKQTALDSKTGSLSELSQLASEARKALKDGLEEAGFTLGSILGWQEWKEWPTDEPLDMEQIASLISALDDGDENKVVLAGLLTVYQEALAALENAGEDTLEQLKETAKTAREALLEALYLAGLLPLADVVPEDSDPLEGAVEN